MGGRKTCKIFNEEGVRTPKNHRDFLLKGVVSKPAIWCAGTVTAILRNPIYTGDMVQGIYDCARFKLTTTKRKPKSEWIITPNTHEPLVSRDVWELAGKMVDARHRPKKNNEVQLFAGYAKCADCGCSMGFANTNGFEYHSCNT